ncbi:hypothetical protein GGR56DRAFT_141981 [Xylariaceae sp. FL0804]|nr:hypothetical protein GGR56DRAFT_141981 [Xylariaceae sp. FL0804]
MSSSRLTAPASKLARRSISTTTSAAVPMSATRLAGSSAAAPLSVKYADLLKERSPEVDHPRHLTTQSANRPHPPPRTLRLMQTFSSSSSSSSSSVSGPDFSAASVDNIVLPGNVAALNDEVNEDPFAHFRMPLLPDGFATQHGAAVASDAPAIITTPEINVVASNADPRRELVDDGGESFPVAALSEIEGMGVDGVELKFVHDAAADAEPEQSMLTNIWQGLDSALGGGRDKSNIAA